MFRWLTRRLTRQPRPPAPTPTPPPPPAAVPSPASPAPGIHACKVGVWQDGSRVYLGASNGFMILLDPAEAFLLAREIRRSAIEVQGLGGVYRTLCAKAGIG